jgi:hypothetical protein
LYFDDTMPTITWSGFYDNTLPPYVGLSDPAGSDGNLSADPGYADTSAADPAEWDLALSPTSPLLDAGYPSILDVDGTASAMGAYGGPNGAW